MTKTLPSDEAFDADAVGALFGETAPQPVEPRATSANPELTITDDVYRFVWASGIEAELERITEHRDELTAELTIRSSRGTRPGLLHSARLNLMSTQSRRSLVTVLKERDADLDWATVIEQLCFLTRERYRSGEPSIDLRTHTPSEGARWLLEPFIESDGPCIVFADGGSGKSMLSYAIAVSIASGTAIVGKLHGPATPVLYLDWESNTDIAHERVHAIARGANLPTVPPVHYRRQYASLSEAAPEIRREIRRLGVGFVVVDSLGAARGGEPESAEVTIRMFNAARSLGVPWLGVDHVTKANGNTGSRPFGSAFTHNLARVTWGADKAEEPGDTSIVVGLKNFKRNNGRLVPAIGYRLDFEGDQYERLWAVRIKRTDLATVPALAGKVPLRQRILAELRSGPVAQADLAERLGEDIKAITARVGELEQGGRVIRMADRRVALKASA